MYSPLLHLEIARQRQEEFRREASAYRLAAVRRANTEEPSGLLRVRDRLRVGRPALQPSA
jgi:hypothetical protein